MNPFGLSSCFGFDFTVDAFRAMKQAGLDAIEVCCSNYDRPWDFDGMKKSADATGIDLWSMHLPLSQHLDISSLDRENNKAALAAYQDMINRGSSVGIGIYVVHPTSTPEPILDGERAEKIKHAMACLNQLSEYAATKGVQVALENLPRTCLCNTVAEHRFMLSAHEKLGACFDLNHCLQENTADFLKGIGDKVITVHVSDRDHINERHWVPGEGIIDWPELMQTFAEIGYRGAWIYELGREAAPTIERKPLTYADLAQNAKTLFAGRVPAPLGTPKPNLGLWGPEE